MPTAAAFTTIEAVSLPVEAMDHIEHSTVTVSKKLQLYLNSIRLCPLFGLQLHSWGTVNMIGIVANFGHKG